MALSFQATYRECSIVTALLALLYLIVSGRRLVLLRNGNQDCDYIRIKEVIRRRNSFELSHVIRMCNRLSVSSILSGVHGFTAQVLNPLPIDVGGHGERALDELGLLTVMESNAPEAFASLAREEEPQIFPIGGKAQSVSGGVRELAADTKGASTQSNYPGLSGRL